MVPEPHIVVVTVRHPHLTGNGAGGAASGRRPHGRGQQPAVPSSTAMPDTATSMRRSASGSKGLADRERKAAARQAGKVGDAMEDGVERGAPRAGFSSTRRQSLTSDQVVATTGTATESGSATYLLPSGRACLYPDTLGSHPTSCPSASRCSRPSVAAISAIVPVVRCTSTTMLFFLGLCCTISHASHRPPFVSTA